MVNMVNVTPLVSGSIFFYSDTNQQLLWNFVTPYIFVQIQLMSPCFSELTIIHVQYIY